MMQSAEDLEEGILHGNAAAQCSFFLLSRNRVRSTERFAGRNGCHSLCSRRPMHPSRDGNLPILVNLEGVSKALVAYAVALDIREIQSASAESLHSVDR